jgi:hypothetical protein
MSRIWRQFSFVIRGIFDEITDKAAYRRHLAVHHAVDTPEEWRRFCDEHWQAAARRPKCC